MAALTGMTTTRRAFRGPAAICALLLSGCVTTAGPSPDAGPVVDAGNSPDVDAAMPRDDAAMPPDDATAGEDAATSDAGPPPSDEFVALYDDVLWRTCGGSACHIAGAPGSDLTGERPLLQMPDAATARAVLVGRMLECASMPADRRIRVVPFDPAASAIMTVDQDGLCGRRHNNMLPPSFTAEDLAAIESWIAAGAR